MSKKERSNTKAKPRRGGGPSRNAGLLLAAASQRTGKLADRTQTISLAVDHRGAPALTTALAAAMNSAPFYRHPFIGCKVLNVQLTSTTVGWNGAQYAVMGNITQGAADNQRTGDIIRVLGADLRMRSTQGTAAAPAANSEYQVTVVYSQLGSLAVTNVYQDVGNAYSGCSPRDWDYSPVVKKLSHVFASVDTYHPMHTHDLSFRCNLLTNYEAGTSTVATGALNVVCISGEDPAAPTQLPSIYGSMQLYYQDV